MARKWEEEYTVILEGLLERKHFTIEEAMGLIPMSKVIIRKHIHSVADTFGLKLKHLYTTRPNYEIEVYEGDLSETKVKKEPKFRPKPIPKESHSKYYLKCLSGEDTVWLSITARDKDQACMLIYDKYQGVTTILYCCSEEEYKDICSKRPNYYRSHTGSLANSMSQLVGRGGRK